MIKIYENDCEAYTKTIDQRYEYEQDKFTYLKRNKKNCAQSPKCKLQKISHTNTTQNTSDAKELIVKRMKVIEVVFEFELFDQSLVFLPVQNLLQLA